MHCSNSGLPPERLEIEITERVLLEKEADYLSTLQHLKNLGISIALDDFGTGYSSLSYLKMFPFDKIKIDRSFTAELLERPECAAIACTVINLGRSLDIITVAEGIETQAQFQALCAAGVIQAQGFLFGRPVPADADHVRRNRWRISRRKGPAPGMILRGPRGTMIGRQTVIDELEEALSSHAIGYRAETLRRVTDLFLFGAAQYSEQEIALFDDVMVRLLAQMETSVRAELARRLANIPYAPQNLIRKLAADRAIEVAGPVLKESERLDDETLVATAKTSGQEHMLAISQRASLSEAVTDVLVERGDHTVALSTVSNPGARFSDNGNAMLVERSKDDHEIAVAVWSRQDIPRRHLLKLFTAASENVRRALEAADRQKTNLIRDLVVEVSNHVQDQMRAHSHHYSEAHQIVTALHQAGELDEIKIREFANSGKFDETTVALSILCDLPIGASERAMVQYHTELLLLLAKAVGLSWNTTKAILSLRAGPGGISTSECEENLASFSKIRHETAAKALQFLRLRERASISKPDAA